MKRELLDKEHEQIIGYLQSIGISDQKLQAEMADHLIVLTELYLEQDDDFPVAFELAKKEIKQNELIEINHHAASFRGYPHFLGKGFLTIVGVLAFAIFFAGIYMKFDHIPRHRMIILIGRRLVIFGLLPLILLYDLTEYANKVKQVLKFVFLFTLFQASAELILRQKVNLIFTGIALFIVVLWILLFVIIPAIKVKDNIKGN